MLLLLSFWHSDLATVFPAHLKEFLIAIIVYIITTYIVLSTIKTLYYVELILCLINLLTLVTSRAYLWNSDFGF